jgi:ferritin
LSGRWRVTRHINAHLDRIFQEKGRTAVGLLNRFVEGQREGVSLVEGLLAVVQRAGPNGLLFVEDFLARRGAYF